MSSKNIDKRNQQTYNIGKHTGCDNLSTVLAVCGNNYVKMISDGRVVKFVHDTQPIIINEKYNKLRRINNDVILGFAGDKVICEKTVKRLKTVMAIYPANSLKLIEVARIVKQILQESKLGFLKVQFIIGGRTLKGEFGLCTLNSSTNFDLDSYFPKYGEHQVQVAMPFLPEDIHSKLIDQHFDQNVTKSKQALDSAMHSFIDKVADMDTTVNKNHFEIEILGKK